MNGSFLDGACRVNDRHENSCDGSYRTRITREELQVLRYKVGERYKVHHDGMNRFLTMFLILSDGFDGGWTYL